MKMKKNIFFKKIKKDNRNKNKEETSGENKEEREGD